MGAEGLSDKDLADALAEALYDASIDAHAYGPVRDHWAGPDGKLGDGPVPFEGCQDRFCGAARDALARHRAARTVAPVAPVPGQLPLEEVRGWNCP